MVGCLSVLTDLLQRKHTLSVTGGIYTLKQGVPAEVRLLPSYKDWKIEVLFSLTITFRTNGL